MNNRSIIVLAIVTLVIVFAATFAYRTRSAKSSADAVPALLFDGLLERLNDAALITIQNNTDTLTITRDASTWCLASKDNFPAEFERVKQLLVNIAQLKPLEPKTSNPDLYPRIGVQLPTEPGSTSTLLEVKDDDNTILASIIVGNQPPGGALNRFFVRRTDAAQAWLAEGRIEVPAAPLDWCNRELCRIDRDRIQTVTVTHADGETFTLTRDDPASNDFTLTPMPEGKALASPNALNGISQGLLYVSLDDVCRIENSPADFAAAMTAQYRAYDGLLITLRVARADPDQYWITLHAEPPPAADAASPDGSELTTEAADLNGRFDGWAFQIPQFKGVNLTKRLDELLTDINPAPAVESPDAPVGPPVPPPPAG